MYEAPTRHRRGYSRIRYGRCDFIVLDAPTDTNAQNYVQTLRRLKCTTLVRTCEPSYSTRPFTDAGIRVIEMTFPDGTGPSQSVVATWLALVHSTFRCNTLTTTRSPSISQDQTLASNNTSPSNGVVTALPAFVDTSKRFGDQVLIGSQRVSMAMPAETKQFGVAPNRAGPIAVHCVAGLGRAPLLVAIALVEEGMDGPMDALQEVRRRRPGALNYKQIAYLERYKPCGLLHPPATTCGLTCVIL